MHTPCAHLSASDSKVSIREADAATTPSYTASGGNRKYVCPKDLPGISSAARFRIIAANRKLYPPLRVIVFAARILPTLYVY